MENLVSVGVVRAQRANAHAEATGNVCSFAQAKYGVNSVSERRWRDQMILFIICSQQLFGKILTESTRAGAIDEIR